MEIKEIVKQKMTCVISWNPDGRTPRTATGTINVSEDDKIHLHPHGESGYYIIDPDKIESFKVKMKNETPT